MNQETMRSTEIKEPWKEAFVKDFMIHFRKDTPYTDAEKLKMFNDAIFAVRNEIPEISHLNRAEEIMKNLPKEEHYRIILKLKEILARKGSERVIGKVTDTVSGMNSV